MDRVDRLREALDLHGLEWPGPLEWPEVVSSTNDVLKRRARDGAPAWSVLCATTQSVGRGRAGRTWTSPPGGLYLSVLLRPEVEGVGLLPLVAGVAVSEMAASEGVKAELKWPNDALVRGRKVAGILTESASGGTGVDWVVVGIGVNVSVEASLLGADLGQMATSLHLEAERPLSVEAAAAAVLARLRVWYDALGSQPASVVDAWRARSVPWWGSFVLVKTQEGDVEGRLRDVDDTGALLLDVPQGGRRRMLSGEVSLVRPIDPPPEGR